MITIDDRESDAQFVRYMNAGSFRIERLEFGDIAFVGNGPNEEPALVGIERKSIGDLLNSITSGRFAGHQLPGLLNSYNAVYVIVEGLYRSGYDGILETRSGKEWFPIERGRKWLFSEVECWLTTQEEMAGVRVRRAINPQETAAIIHGLHQWWCSKSYNEHRSHLTLHKPHDTALLRKASLVRVIAAELPGIGWVRSEQVAKRFHTIAELVAADIKEWEGIEGIGKETARKVVSAMYGMDLKAVKERRA